jgi:two-component system, sensor histidine kinase and response regulator
MFYLNWRLLPFFGTVDGATAYQGTYEPSLVFLSLSIAVLAAFVALSIANRIGDSRTLRARSAWTTAGAISMGGGIWAMHFIGMLAFTLPCGVDYNPFGTLLSMIPGAIASGIALTIIAKRGAPSIKNLLAGAVLMGGGIGAMHYAGMAAMEPQAVLLYDPVLVGVSVVVAIALAFVSLGIRFRFSISEAQGFRATFAAAIVMGFAVSGMHYTAMQAAIFFPQPDPSILNLTLPKATLSIGIAIVTCLVATSALLSTFAARQTELAQTLRAEVARREELERETESGRARVQAILDGVVDGVVTINKEGRILQWSTGAERLFGYTVEEAVGADITMLMPGPHRSIHDRYVNAFLTTREAKIIGTGHELSAIRKDGTEFPMELAVNEVRANGEILFTGILRDITERKRAETALIQAREQAESASVAKSQFLATMSHEIRTPMNGILGMANLLATSNLSDRQRRLIASLSGSGQALLALINDILDFSKIEAGRFELFESDFDPRDVLAEVAALFCERCAAKNLELIYFVAEDVPRQLRGDPVRLRQVIINLVGNAIKFTESGEILLEMTVAQRDQGDVVLSVSVEDTGIGIEASKRDKVFESFHQVDNSITRARGGSGLGLTISRQLVELMGGKIGVESEMGRGSRFYFTVRFIAPEAGETAPRQLAKPLRVLLVDTNAVSAHVMSLYLGSWNVDAAAVATVAEATEAATDALSSQQPFDAAIIDVKGLGDSGIALAHQLRDNKAAPSIVLLIGMDGTLSDETLEGVGAVDMFTKPARPNDLFDVLNAITQGEGNDALARKTAKRNAQSRRPQFDAHILVAEDNPVNQDVAVGLLQALGCRVVTAPNGRSAVQSFAQEKFDLILMDCEMPIVDGLEATKRIRQLEELEKAQDGKGTRIPIIALTAHALADIHEGCIAAGMDDFITKPYDETQIVAALRRWIASLEREAMEQHEMAEKPASATIDTAAIAAIRAMDSKGDDALLKSVVAKFLATSPAIVARIRENIAADNAEAVWRAAHSLKSSAGALGAKLLAQRCATIETVAREKGVDAIKDLVETLETEFNAAAEQLQEMTRGTYESAA